MNDIVEETRVRLTLNDLADNLLLKVFELLGLKDFASLHLVNHRFWNLIHHSNNLWYRECLSLFFSPERDYTSYYPPNPSAIL